MQDLVVVVTGGFGALGGAVCEAFQTAGARVAAIGHAKLSAAEVARESPHFLPLGGVDLTQFERVAGAMQTITERFERIDVLVNVAGGFRSQTVGAGELGGWDEMYATNLKTAVVACKAALPRLLKSTSGRIINIAAAAALKAGAGMGAYAASKAGVLRLTESLAEELKDQGVTVNAVLPGTIDTAQNRTAMPDADRSRWVAPQALADVVVFLASTGARAVTGAAIPVLGRGR